MRKIGFVVGFASVVACVAWQSPALACLGCNDAGTGSGSGSETSSGSATGTGSGSETSSGSATGTGSGSETGSGSGSSTESGSGARRRPGLPRAATRTPGRRAISATRASTMGRMPGRNRRAPHRARAVPASTSRTTAVRAVQLAWATRTRVRIRGAPAVARWQHPATARAPRGERLSFSARSSSQRANAAADRLASQDGSANGSSGEVRRGVGVAGSRGVPLGHPSG